MSLTVPVRAFAQFSAFGLILFAFSQSAAAECSHRKVEQMLEKGRTIASIARTCEMSRDDVQSILDDGEDDGTDGGEDGGTDNGVGSGGLPSGTPVGQCGCWGYASPEMRQPHSQCQSGYARPNICNALCPAGGYAWRGVCT